MACRFAFGRPQVAVVVVCKPTPRLLKVSYTIFASTGERAHFRIMSIYIKTNEFLILAECTAYKTIKPLDQYDQRSTRRKTNVFQREIVVLTGKCIDKESVILSEDGGY